MRPSWVPGRLLLATFSLLPACSGPGLDVRNVPENGYEETLNYQFQAQVHSDSEGRCRMLVVRVRPINKLYSNGEPPSRLHLFDDDCMSPLRFERVQYISRRTGEPVRLVGPEINRFFSEYDRLEGELIDWLFDEGVI